MKQFIYLTSRIINKLQITQIVKQSNHYEICLTNNAIGGFFLVGNGTIDTTFNIIEICNKEDKQDYETITKLIEQELL
jgi:hypothetical protein